MAGNPRSFRFDPALLERLTEQARRRGTTVSALVERYADEGSRAEDHPLIVFRDGEAGRRPTLVGTRLEVWRIIETLRLSGNSTAATAEYFDIPESHVLTALRYYADFQEEVDDIRERELAFAAREEEAWRRAQAALG